ncbi:MAG: COR domain-containing protein [Cyanobacteria bacterium J06634_5]
MNQQQLLKKIEKAAQKKTISLDLSRTQLNSLPAEVGQLINLRLLNLSSNQLSSLPAEIGQLINLKSLTTRYTRLSSLPVEIGQLTNLKLLSLSSTQLSSLPAEIGQLTNLQSLDLNCTQLSNLPAEIGQLTNLQSLDLGCTQLSNLPAEIGRLTNLRSLSLSSTQLSSLPAEIGQLNNLQSLDLNGTQLSSLPAEIGQLGNLQSLNLNSTPLSSLPAEIGQLNNLQSLSLSDIPLSSLPAEIGQLNNLRSLYLRSTQLNSLPAEIGQLSNLRSLYLRSTQLSNLPAEIQKYCDDPQLAAVELPRYYRQLLEQKTDLLYEAKLLIVGEGGAGKTSLAKKIVNGKYQLAAIEQSTEGIDITRWKFQFNKNREFIVNIWDFGGQEIYHATHQFFLTKRSLYLLVADSRQEDTDFYYWLNVVNLLSESSPILIVNNEKQDRQRKLNERQLRGEFLNLKEIRATNLASNRGLPEIKQAIRQHICTLPHIGTELPKTWVKVRRALENDTRNYIAVEEYLKLCEDNGFTRLEDKLQLSEYLHDLGVCLHFQKDDLLRKTVILKPTWGTDAVYKVLDNNKVIQNLGKFDRAELAAIWNETQYASMRPELLRLMMNFKLCYEIPSRPNTYIAPQLLSAQQPDYPFLYGTETLLLRYSYGFMPKGILTRFIVEMHRWIEKENCVWKTGVVLNKNDAHAEVIELYHRKEIQIRVYGHRRRDLLTTIRHEFDKIHNTYERLKWNTLVPCNCRTCKEEPEPYFYEFKNLEERLANNKITVECNNSPYLDVSISSLIDDIGRQAMRQDSSHSRSRNKVFISYSHQDTTLFNELKVWLKSLERSGKLKVWDDTKIKPGEQWRQEIAQALATAKVAILLVSPHFIASDFIDNNELPSLLSAAENEGLTVLWIPISYSPYKDTAFEKYQAVHPPQQPLDTLEKPQRNKAWNDIYQKIQAAFKAS